MCLFNWFRKQKMTPMTLESLVMLYAYIKKERIGNPSVKRIIHPRNYELIVTLFPDCDFFVKDLNCPIDATYYHLESMDYVPKSVRNNNGKNGRT